MNIMVEKFVINNLNDTKNLAESIADQCSIGNVITLNGTLGAGKTYFTSCFINYLLKKNGLETTKVVSPTFNIVKEYKIDDFSVYHFDLYRLKNKNELYELDIENAFENGISIIEWPEIAEDVIYNVVFNINIEITGENTRIFNVEKVD